jgi:hypothetical protein
MRIQGRTLRASNLAERRVLLSLGVDHHNFRLSRRLNPFAVARCVRRLASGRGGDLPALKAMLAKKMPPAAPVLPDSTSTPRSDGEQRAA